jgi:outer membrane protein
MKMLRSLLILACVGCVALALPAAAAESRIATVDLKKVFEDYYKTKLADAAIKEEAGGLDKDRKAIIEDHTKAMDDYKKALDEANNQAISADEREKRKKEAEGRLIKINDLRQTVEQFDRTAKQNLDEKLRITREKILKEIKDVITTKSKSGNFTLVLDSSTAEPAGRPPVVLYTNGDNDLTAAVLEQLNANAPADLPKADGRKDEKK